MAYRRRRVSRRKPVRRYQRRLRRRFRRRRRSGNLLAKLTKVSQLTVKNNITSIWNCSFYPEDFKEYTQLAKNFESVKFLRVRVTVLPLQNVANSTTSVAPAYAMTPWHYAIDLPKEFSSYLSMDKAKIFRQTHIGSQAYVPNIMSVTQVRTAGSGATSNSDQIVWRPEIRANVYAATEKLPNIKCGAIAFQGATELTGSTLFNIKTDVYCVFKSQNQMII